MLWNKNKVLQALSKQLKAHIGFEFSSIRFSIDSRTIKKGDIFIALVGKNFDGHDFIKAALEGGASAIIAHQERWYNIKYPVILVENTLYALHELAKFFLQINKPKIVAITGSNGKTTTKNMVHKLLSNFAKTSATTGNFNNNIGLPLCILNCDPESKFLVLEMGINHVDELAQLVTIAPPDVGVITNIGSSHIGNFGSKNKIALAKAEIFKNSVCIAVINQYTAEFDTLLKIAKEKASNVITFGIHKNSDIRYLAYENSMVEIALGNIKYCYTLPDYGFHFVQNSLSAIASVYALGLEFDETVLNAAFQNFHPENGRGNHYNLEINGKKILLIDDSYNASYESVSALAEYVRRKKGKKILVLGSIAEGGDYLNKIYKNLADKMQFFDGVTTVGNDIKFICEFLPNLICHYNDIDSLIPGAKLIIDFLDSFSVIAVKGSRYMHLEKLVSALINYK